MIRNNGRKISYFTGIALAVFVVALGLNSYSQANSYYKKLLPRVQIAVFVENKHAGSLDVIKEKLLNIDGIANLDYISPDQALKKALQENPELSRILIPGDNPFAPYFILKPEKISLAGVQYIKNKADEIEGVDDVRYDFNLVNILENLGLFTSFYSLAGKFLWLAVLILIGGRFLWRWLHKSVKYESYVYAAVSGMLSGFAGAALYLSFSRYLIPGEVVSLPSEYLIYLIFSGVVLALIWEN